MMKNQSVRLWIVAFSGIGILTLFWGYRGISTGIQSNQSALEQSLDQELISLTAAVQASVQSVRWQLVDVLKAEASDRLSRADEGKPSRVFSNSIFNALALMEASENSWKLNWLTVAPSLQNSINAKVLRERFAEWKQKGFEGVQFHRLPDVGGLHYFAAVMPLIKGASKMVAIGIFQPSQFSLALSQAHTREVKVVTEDGFALALSHPAYLGSSLRGESFIKQLLSQDELSLRSTFKNERSQNVVAAGQRLADSNLFVVVEAPIQSPWPWILKSILFMLLSGGAAGGLTWWLLKRQFADLVELTFQLSEQVDQIQSRPLMSLEKPNRIPQVEMPEVIPTNVLKAPTFSGEEAQGANSSAPLAAATPITKAKGVAIESILTTTVERLQKKYQNQNIETEIFGLTGLSCAGDQGQLKAAFDEILKNAFEAVENYSTKKITVYGEQHDGFIRLTISDSGPGISPENLKKVFDPFFSTKTSGTAARGLGLNVVRRVVEEIKGQVDILSEGQGTRVELTLPLDAEVGVPKANTGLSDFQMLNLDFEELEKQASKPLPPVNIRKPKVRFLD